MSPAWTDVDNNRYAGSAAAAAVVGDCNKPSKVSLTARRCSLDELRAAAILSLSAKRRREI